MEIGSLGGMHQSMGAMRSQRPLHGDPAERADAVSAAIMEQQDSDADGLLTKTELGDASDLIAQLDGDGDGVLSQAELQTGLQTAMEEGKAALQSGNLPSAETRELMQTMQSLSGMKGPSHGGNKAMASQAYGMMQEALFGGSQETASFNPDQLLLENLNMTV